MLANPVTLKPYFEADEAMKAIGGVGYLALLTGSGVSASSARAILPGKSMISPCCARWSIGRPHAGGDARPTPASRSNRKRPDRGSRNRALQASRAAMPNWGRRRSFGAAAKVALANASRRAMNCRWQACPASRPGLSMTLNAKDGRIAQVSDLHDSGRSPRYGQDFSLATNIAFAAAERWKAYDKRTRNRGRKEHGRQRPCSSLWKCRQIS